mgnify:CR=1 FL=1
MPDRDAHQADLTLIAQAARDAGDIARRFWKRAPKVWEKDAGAGPVTEADLAVNEMLMDRLRAARPDYGWLSEETPDDGARLGAGRVFILDPLDGTRAFIAGEPTFAHSIAVVAAGKVVAGAVFLPVSDLLYTATLNGPALCNGAPIAASAPRMLEQATLLTARRNMAPELWLNAVVPPLRRDFRASLAYRLCLVAEGRFDAMLAPGPTWEWDVAAGALIAGRAGANVTDRQGCSLRFNRPDPRTPGVVAAGDMVHAAIVAGLAPAPGQP